MLGPSRQRGHLPDLCEALGWIGAVISDRGGARVGTVEDIYIDHGMPELLVVRAGWLRHRHRTMILPVGALEARGLRVGRVGLAPRVGALALRLLRP
jgi:hypothetical protein